MTEETPPPLNKGGRKRGVWTFTTPEALIRWRTENNISRAKVARRLGVAFSAVERWENGAAVALPELQQRLAELVGEEPVDLEKFGHEPSNPTSANPDEVSVIGTTAIVTEYIKHSKLAPDTLVKLTRELRNALR